MFKRKHILFFVWSKQKNIVQNAASKMKKKFKKKKKDFARIICKKIEKQKHNL